MGSMFVVVDQQRHGYHSSMGTTVKRILEVQLGLQSRNFHAGPDRGCTSINEAENSIPRCGSAGLRVHNARKEVYSEGTIQQAISTPQFRQAIKKTANCA